MFHDFFSSKFSKSLRSPCLDVCIYSPVFPLGHGLRNQGSVQPFLKLVLHGIEPATLTSQAGKSSNPLLEEPQSLAAICLLCRVHHDPVCSFFLARNSFKNDLQLTKNGSYSNYGGFFLSSC